jgi:hypothetical protein
MKIAAHAQAARAKGKVIIIKKVSMRISPTMNSRTANMIYKSLLEGLIFSYDGSIHIYGDW